MCHSKVILSCRSLSLGRTGPGAWSRLRLPARSVLDAVCMSSGSIIATGSGAAASSRYHASPNRYTGDNINQFEEQRQTFITAVKGQHLAAGATPSADAPRYATVNDLLVMAMPSAFDELPGMLDLVPRGIGKRLG